MLFLGAPGTGKTMLSKGIATSFNCPFVSIPGSGFAQTFIGMDAVLVRYLARKAKKLAAKWGGQCIVFIDEIDAVGMRRQSLGSGYQPTSPRRSTTALLRPHGALTPTATSCWRPRPGASGCSGSAPSRRRSRTRPGRAARGRDQALHDPRHGRDGRRPRAQPAAGGHGRHRRPAGHQALPDPPLEHVPRRALRRPPADRAAAAAPAAAAPAQGGDLLHRRVQRAAPAARPGAHPPGPDGPPHLLPHPRLGGPARHLRPLPRQGRPRGGARRAAPPRRARPHHQRLLAGDDRPGLLARAHLRARRRARALRAHATSSRR